MPELSPLVRVAVVEAFVFAAVLAVGGLIGWLKRGSKMSAVMGVLTSLIVSVSAWYAAEDSWRSSMLALSVTALSLTAFFFERYINSSRKFMPGGLMTVASCVSFVLYLTAIVFG